MKKISYFRELRSNFRFFQFMLKTILGIETGKKTEKKAGKKAYGTRVGEESAQEQNLPFKSEAILVLNRYYQLEEELSSYSSPQMTEAEENEIAQLTDRILTGKQSKGYSSSHYFKAYQTWLADEAMSQEAGEWHPLPTALRKTVRAAFTKKGKSQLKKAVERATLLIEMGCDGLRVLEAELNGFTESWPSAVATRSATLSQQEIPPDKHVVLRRPVPKRGLRKREDNLECEILRELGNSLTMVIRVPLSCLKTRVDLIQNGKILDTRAFAASCTAVSFEHLKPGRYNLLFKGAIQNDFTVIISESKAA